MDATRGTGTAYPYRASEFNHVKIVWVLDNLAKCLKIPKWKSEAVN
jgi:hypothetical protein